MPNPVNIQEKKKHYWKLWYIVVVTFLVAEIFLFAWLTNKYK